MDIRCPSCSKLFRVADEKIAGKGIRFKCSKCSEVITITKDDFEMDLLAREGEPAPPVAPPSAPPPKPAAAPAPPPPAAEPEAREYKPPVEQSSDEEPAADQQLPAASLGEFDFSEPHAAATAAAHPAEGFGGDFAFGAEHEQEQTAPEIEISPEAAAEAEASLDFPVDLISEPKRKPAFGAAAAPEPSAPPAEPAPELGAGPDAAEEELDLGAALAMPKEPAAAFEPAAGGHEAAPGPAPATQAGPVFTPELLAQMKKGAPARPGAQAKAPAPADDDMDLGAALRIPTSGSSDAPPVDAVLTAGKVPASAGGIREEIHPFAAGNLTGAVAGMGCALPIAALLTLSAGIVMKLFPVFAGAPLYHLIALVVSGVVSMGVLIGIVISIVQAKAGKKLFFLLHVLVGSLFGSAFGVGERAAVSLVTGGDLSLPAIVDSAVNAAIAAFILSVLIVAARRLLVHGREESFSADLSVLQKAGLGVSLLVLLFAVYESGSFAGKLQRPGGDPRRTAAGTARPETITPAGLQVANANAYFDPGNGDLVITGSVRNTLDKPKSGWYLVIEVRDTKEAVLATAKMLNGAQLYSAREYEALAKRGANIDELKKRTSAAVGKGVIAARSSVDFEVRIVNPPAGSAGFLPTLQSFDPAVQGPAK